MVMGTNHEAGIGQPFELVCTSLVMDRITAFE